jgi:23S rRNA (guanine2445-N2)-methyltransferase / 23S rRNA (guanine2069-N7)-methyltransferase
VPTTCFVACASGLENILESELLALGVKKLKRRRAGVDCALDVSQIYRVCLWSRVANRVLYPLTAFRVNDEKHYYQQLKDIDWSRHLSEDGTLAVDFFCADSVITHSRYGAQLTKDAVVDWFRERSGQRPSVDRATPDVRINVYLYKNRARVNLDMAGSSLHRRNYRQQGGMAPLKENLAAAIVLAARWPELASTGASFFDPMCGSGTLLIEAGLIAANRAPGLLRDYFGFIGWRGHQPDVWGQLREEAAAAKPLWVQNGSRKPLLAGTDIDKKAVTAARENIGAAGLEELVSVECEDFFNASAYRLAGGPGLLVTNPPYGERLEDNDNIAGFYSQLGKAVKRRAPNWRLALFTGKPALFHRTGLSRRVVLECANGGIDCKLLIAEIPPAPGTEQVLEREKESRTPNPAKGSWPDVAAQARSGGQRDLSPEGADNWFAVDSPGAEASNKAGGELSGDEPGNVKSDVKSNEKSNEKSNASGNVPGVEQFADRLRKNLKQLKGWAKSAEISNYRVYDADLPDFAVAVDVYGVDSPHGPFVCVQEYRAPSRIDPLRAQQRLDAAIEVVVLQLGCKPENLGVKRRERQRAESQYQRLQKQERMVEVSESGCRILINLHDYLDVGLFLDHRKVRQWIGKLSRGKRFLNLYCYTAVATLHAALGGAESSVSVDLSHKYLEWARANFQLNEIDPQKHELIHDDCDRWLSAYSESKQTPGHRSDSRSGDFDLIFLDPPTFSNSTSMDGDWDVQRDHMSMIDRCMAILNPGGTLVFSNNFRRFKLSEEASKKYRVDNRTRWSLQRDFSRNPRIHQCWFIRHQAD